MEEQPRLVFELGMYTDVISDEYFGRLGALLRRFLKVGSIPGITIQHIKVFFDKPRGCSEPKYSEPCAVTATIACKNISVNFAGGHLLKIADYVLSFPYQYQKGSVHSLGMPPMTFEEFEKLFKLAALKALQDAVDAERQRNQDFESWFTEAKGIVPGLR